MNWVVQICATAIRQNNERSVSARDRALDDPASMAKLNLYETALMKVLMANKFFSAKAVRKSSCFKSATTCCTRASK